MWTDDTIAAIATAPGESGLCLVRMSGPVSLTVADRVFRGRIRPSRCRSHTIHYGHLVDPASGEIIDEVLLTVMRAPRSFTREDVAEISGHGGVRPGYRILDVLIRNGARMAHPGEFTRRAFLNGRLDLLQAEAVAEIIRSRTDAGIRAALRQLDGRFSQTVNALRDRLIDLLALVEVGLDFTEDGIEGIAPERLHQLARGIHADLTHVVNETNRWRVLRDGARVAIVGRPNVGKSSLLNALLGRDRAIVDPTPGTTRDTIEEMVDVQGIPVTLVDTAGLRIPGDSVEARGIERAERELALADVFIWVVDGTEPLRREDLAIADRVAKRQCIAVINKVDAVLCIDVRAVTVVAPHQWLHVSAQTGVGIEDVKAEIVRCLVGSGDGVESDVLVNARHQAQLASALDGLGRAIDLLRGGVGQEVVAVELREAVHDLGEIVGKDIGDAILDRVFATFCIGK